MTKNKFGRLLKGVGADMNPIVLAGAQRAIQKQIRGKKYPIKGGGKKSKKKKTPKQAKKKLVNELSS